MKIRLVFLLIAVPVLDFLGLSYWYMVRCEGDWEGVPMEAGMERELAEIENTLRADVSFLSETLGPRNPSHYASLIAASEWISERWNSQGYEVKWQTFIVEGKECANLEIEIPGRRLPFEIVIIGAQYDTWPETPGANNNAGGVAVLLKLSDMLKGQQPDRTLRLAAFTTQEPPYSNTEFMGSLRYAKRCKELGENIRIMLCMDAIGVYKQDPGTQKLPFPFSLFYPDRGNFLAFIADLGSRPEVIVATRGFKKGSSFPIESGCAPRWVKGVTWSDHASFWKYGYRAIQITDTGAFRSSAHTSGDDTMEKIDFNALARITVGMCSSVLEFASIDG
ncbi:MAG: M28 family peptidase [Candidatus Zixiibacteriota bacterium]|nr:MAG: M28 family peptidase [candidate division Zixibacteria bacterium]